MKKYSPLPAAALAGGVLCFLLRLAQNRTGFEPDTGLPVAGNAFAIALPAALAVTAAVILALAFRLPSEKEDTKLPFTGYFMANGSLLLTLLVSALFLWVLSGAMEVFSSLGRSSGGSAGILSSSGIFLFPQLSLLMGLLSIVSAVSLFPLVTACKRREESVPAGFNGNLLLVPVACLVIRLVLAYREDSVNPALGAYYVEILSLTFLILSLYRASSFAFHCGRTRRFAVYTACALTLCITALSDCRAVSDALFDLGGALLTLSLLLMRLNAAAHPLPTQD